MDTNLVVRAQQGDHYAFAVLAEDTWARLYQLALRILRDPDTAEEAAEQALVTIWRKLPGLRDPSRFDAWSYRVVVNTCNSVARQRGRRGPEIGWIPGREPTAPETLGAVIDRDELERGFSRLPVDQRAVLVMHHYLDMPVEAVADVLGVPVGTVKSRLHRALKRMRIALHADAPIPQTSPIEPSR